MKRIILWIVMYACILTIKGQTSQILSSGTPLFFTSTGTGTYNQSVFYHNYTNGFVLELAKISNDINANPIDFRIGSRGATHNFFTIKGASGDIGIGTSSPNGKLHISAVSNESRIKPKDLIYLTATNSNVGYDGFGTSIVDFRRTYQNSTPHAVNRISFIERGHSTLDKGGAILFATKTLNSGSEEPEERMRIDYNGNVGIGTIAPSEDLHIESNDRTVLKLKTNSATDDLGIWFQGKRANSSANSSHYIGADGDSHYNFKINADEAIKFQTNGTDKMIISSNGNVGVGTSTPSNVQGWGKVLDVAGTGNSKILATSVGATFKTGMFSHNSWYGGGGFIGTESSHNLHLLAGYSSKMVIRPDGYIGIGTTIPEQKLDVVNGSIQVRAMTNGRKIKLDAGSGNIELTGNATVLQINRFSTNNIALATGGGNVAVGTLLAPTGYKLAVAGKTITEEVKVQLQANWPDYVFEKNYELPSLAEVEQHIKERGHLENIPSAEEVKKDGFFLGAMDAKLLQKIEELTLYTIQQEKEIQNLKARNTEIETVKKQNEALQEKLNKLEKLVQKLL